MSTFQNFSMIISALQCICMKKIKNICPWLVNWNVQWNVWGGTLQFLGMSTDKMFTRCKFSMKRQKTDDQKASVYHVATASVRFRIWYNYRKYFKNILKYFSTLWNTIRWPFYKPGEIFRCFKQVINTYLVAASIRTGEKTQFHFVINMRKILSQNFFVINFVITN